MGVDNFSVKTGGSQRRAKRNRVLLAARVKTKLGEFEVRLRDLSQKGALVECTQYLDVNEEVVFTRGTTIVPARVAWSGGGRIGLEFLRTIDESEVLVQLGRPATTQTQQRFRRPRINGEDLTDQERKLARVWGMNVGLNVS